MRYPLLAPVVVIWVVAWAIRTAAMPVLRPRHPRAAELVERWWAWAPIPFVLLVMVLVHPLLGLAAVLVGWFALTAGGAIGSPFRPRR